MDRNDYDIYVIADVEELKRRYAELLKRHEETVHELATAYEEIDRYRRASAYEEKDYIWLTD